ncbi:MAG TPA: hypothetical protein PLU24_01630, partial [Candidatus Omnitrophota bacterium]|nr:hypothetical protein [Candidatus Omnitrophota bacterium]
PKGRGSSFSLFMEMRRRALSNAIDHGEWVIYNFNYPMMRILDKMGASLSKVKYVFHKWIKK